jgi:hypothetical protein
MYNLLPEYLQDFIKVVQEDIDSSIKEIDKLNDCFTMSDEDRELKKSFIRGQMNTCDRLITKLKTDLTTLSSNTTYLGNLTSTIQCPFCHFTMYVYAGQATATCDHCKHTMDTTVKLFL